MPADGIQVIQRGDSSGNNMTIRITLSSGRHIYGFATENSYGGDWDIGPTWNYLVTGDRPFLVDSGRRGTGMQLLKMIEGAGFTGQDIESVFVSHGHEDHDGGLFELANLIDVRVVAHEVYGALVRSNPKAAPSDEKVEFPASCWCCPMPETFYHRNCLEYHKERQALTIMAMSHSTEELGSGVQAFHTPGHCPDSVVLLVDGEAMLAGDTVLPEITPHPTLESHFTVMKPALPEKFAEAQQLFGLRAYIRSLKMLRAVPEFTDKFLVLPAHRFTVRTNGIKLTFVAGLTKWSSIISIDVTGSRGLSGTGPKTPREIAMEYFQPGLLKGFGIHLAVNEIKSHCELMEISRDVVVSEEGNVSSTGGENFRSLISDAE